MKPFPSLKYENGSALLSTCQEATCQIFWMLLSTLQSCPGVLPGDSRTNVQFVQFARCPPASSSSPWTRQSRVSRFRWRRTRWQGSAPADWSETSWKRKRWSASDSNYGQLRFSTNHIITCPFQDKMKKDLENEKPPRPRSGFAPSTSWLAGALSLILSHFDPSNNCQGWIREAIVREVQLFFNIVQTGDGGQTHVQKLCCKFCIIQRALWQHKLRHRKDF